MTNNSYIDVDLVGVRVTGPDSIADTAVLCHTNRVVCSGEAQLGNWFFPDGSTVLGFNASGGEAVAPFFARNRGPSVVRLYRVDNETAYPPQRGRFCCVVPDTSGNNQTHCVNICMFLYS